MIIEGISDCSSVIVLMLLLVIVSSTKVFEYVIDYSMALVSTTIDSSYSYSIATVAIRAKF